MTELSDLVRRTMEDVLGQRNKLMRECAFDRLWNGDAELRTIDGIHVGSHSVCKHVGELLNRCPEYDFSAVGELNEVAGAATVRWTFGMTGEQPGYTGFDVIVYHEGKVSLVCRFLDGPVW